MKKTFKYIIKTVIGFLLFIGLYVLSAFGLSKITVNSTANQAIITSKKVEIFILSNGVHTDIVVPVKKQLL